MIFPEWWEDWRGATVLVAASGPSQFRDDIEYARGKCRVVVINTTWRLAPWADMLYASDARWYQDYGPTPEQFPGRRVCGEENGPHAEVVTRTNEPHLNLCGEKIGGGANSSFQAANLLLMWGVRKIVFTGLDCKARAECNPKAKVHWHGEHKTRGNPKAESFEKWIANFTKAAPIFAARGCEVVNASRESEVKCFPRMTLEEALA